MIGKVPDGWEIKEFLEVFKDDTAKKKKIPTNNYLEIGDIPVIDQGKKAITGYTNDTNALNEDQPIIIFGDHTRALKYIDFNFAIGADGVKVLKNIEKNSNTKYLYYALLNSYIPNTGYNRHFQYVKRLQIPIPPLPQQEKIVKVLDISSALIEKQKELLKKYDLFLKSKFIEMFGDPVKNPMGWEVEKLENLIQKYKGAMKTGPFGSSLKKEFYVENGYKIYGQEQVIKNDFSYGNYYIDGEKYETLKSYAIKEKDILISLVGTFGKIAVVPKIFEAGIINPRLMKISLNLDLYNPIFFKKLFYTEAFKAQLLNFSHGGTMGILNLTILKELKYIKPPIELQNKFASIVEKTEQIKEKETQKLEHLQTLHNSLMDKAFKGEIK